MTSDPLAPLLDLPGVRDAADRARDALSAVHRHPANLRGWDKTATEASWRAGRSSAAIDGGSVELRRDGDFDDPLLAGAMRVAQALDGDALDQLTGVFRRAPAQAFARLHMLAAADLVADPDELGRPSVQPGVAGRLDLLGQLITGATSVPAPVLAAVVHGELLGVGAFPTANGVVARAASRLVCTSSGLDPHNLGVPEVTWLRRLDDYRSLSTGFADGDPTAVGAWIVLCCEALEAGAGEARSIADAARAG
ncbi:oxidoreductase [Gordonia hankookensis]|uniref:Oxidoreductase n=1 Tax=Gordonia hankookensis TaxID=589403 RepID=A0ABR7WHY0_9ACTN|nr:oxidoreductase [Gordonia hankookensis]MBD1322359.1 oxidoreductase [Gordonia hankookensis]NDZ97697.1 oxidoreductase [Streptomyces sp. SID11726]NEB26832.1 oxidoreductase [Streptomyces sp. SID6673]